MNISIPLTLTPAFLSPFRAAWLAASDRTGMATGDLIERCLRTDLHNAPDALMPQLGQVPEIARLVADPHWMLDQNTRRALVGALAYFDQTDDLIPDDNPQFGLLDDAIVIGMALDEHREVWSAWQDYRRFCADHAELGPMTRTQWIELTTRISERTRRQSFVEHRYANQDQRSRYCMTSALPRIDLN